LSIYAFIATFLALINLPRKSLGPANSSEASSSPATHDAGLTCSPFKFV